MVQPGRQAARSPRNSGDLSHQWLRDGEGNQIFSEAGRFFRKQAAKAERMAQAAPDPEISQRLLNMARAYRSQADVLKAKKKSGKKRR